MSNQIPRPNRAQEAPNTGFEWAARQMALVQQYQVLRPQLVAILTSTGARQELLGFGPTPVEAAIALAPQLRAYQKPSEAADLEHLVAQIQAQTVQSSSSVHPTTQNSATPLFPDAVVNAASGSTRVYSRNLNVLAVLPNDTLVRILDASPTTITEHVNYLGPLASSTYAYGPFIFITVGGGNGYVRPEDLLYRNS